MDEKIKTKWLAALRSGDYTQTKEYLRRSTEGGRESFCCLGVLCDIMDPKGWKKPKFDDGFSFDNPNHRGCDQTPSEKILRKAGLNGKTETGVSIVSKLTTMNDTGKKGFKYIANWIEKNL